MTRTESWTPAGFELEVEKDREGPRTLAEAEHQLGLVLASVVRRLSAEADRTQQAS
jgi:hypothetical protein